MDEHCHFSTKKVRADDVLGLGDSAGKGDRMDGDIIIELDPGDASQGSVVMIGSRGQTVRMVEVSHVPIGNCISTSSPCPSRSCPFVDPEDTAANRNR